MRRIEAMSRLSSLRAATGLLLVLALAGCGPSGPSTQVNQPTGTAATSNYTGPAPRRRRRAGVQGQRCGRTCARRIAAAAATMPAASRRMFARSDDVNLAYQAALPLVNSSQPGQSTFVLKVGSGHNCWVASPQACADTMLTWVQNWIGGGIGASEKVQLVPPPSQSVGGTQVFPADAQGLSNFETLLWTPILRQFCSGCHDPNSRDAAGAVFRELRSATGVSRGAAEDQPGRSGGLALRRAPGRGVAPLLAHHLWRLA